MKGFCVWFTGLPASGKTTNARNLLEILQKENCSVEILDGDDLRKGISKELGFSRQDRETHLRRVAEMALEIVQQDRAVLCALVSPYQSIRDEGRRRVGEGRFIEVFVDASLMECERRDPKGLYARARRGEIAQFTGISDPYETPLAPDLRLDTVAEEAPRNAQRVRAYLMEKGFLPWR